MKFRSRKFWLLTTVLVALVLLVVLWIFAPRGPAVILTLPDNRKFQFVKADWGTQHTQPIFLSRLMHSLPNPAARFLQERLKPHYGFLYEMYSGDPTFFLWFKPLDTNSPASTPGSFPPANSWNVLIADGNGVTAGTTGMLNFLSPPAYSIPWAYAYNLKALPRRSRNISLKFYPNLRPGMAGSLTSNQPAEIQMPNPFFGHFEQWKPEPLPATSTRDGLTVTLSNIAIGRISSDRSQGSPPPTKFERAPQDATPDTFIAMGFSSATSSTESWTPEGLELADATGNVLTNAGKPLRIPNGNWAIPGTLWPDEDAWRVQMFFKRTSGLSKQELLKLTNIPVPAAGATNGITISTNFAGVELTLRNFPSFSQVVVPGYPAPGIFLEWKNLPPDTAVDLVQITSDAGTPLAGSTQPIQAPSESGTANVGLDFYTGNLPADVKSLDITIGVQKLRTFDFYVKPPTATNWK